MAFGVQLEAIGLETHLIGRIPRGRSASEIRAIRATAQHFDDGGGRSQDEFDGSLRASCEALPERAAGYRPDAKIRIEARDERIGFDEAAVDLLPDERFQMDDLA